MAAPRFIIAGVGKTDAGDAWTYSSDVAASALGNLLILQILQDGTTSGAVTLSSGQYVEKLDGTANDWTSIGAFNVGSPTAAIQHLWIGRATSTSSAPYASGANSTSEDLYIRVYEFDRVSTGTTLATVIENVTAGATVNVVGTSDTASDASVTTLGPDRLALNFVAVNDDNIIAQFSGQSGGAWSRVFTWYAESSGTDGSIQLQAAYLGIGVSESGSSSSILGAGGTNEQRAQSFDSGAGGSVTSVVLRTDKTGTPTDSLIVEIQTDAAGVPSGTVVGTAGEVPVADFVNLAGVTAWNVFPVTATLSASTTYWIVVRRSGSRDAVNYIRIIGNSSDVYSGGTPATMNSGTWTAGTNDLGFAIPLGSGSTIDGGTASITDIDAWGVVGFALIGTTSGTTTVPGSFTANAAIKKTIQSSFTANAVIFANSGTKTFAANAVIWNTDADYWDDFNRTVSSSMGTSPDTTDWANDSNWDVNGAAYRTFNNSGLFGTYPRFDHVDVENVRLRTLVSFSTNPTVGTDGHWFHLHVRDQNPTLNNVIAAAFRFRPGGNVDVRVDQRNNGDADWTWSVITNATIGTWSDLTTEKWWLEIDLTGANAELRAWKDGTSRPSSASRSGTLPSPFTGGGATGLRCGTSHTSDSVFSIWQWEVWELSQIGSFTADAVAFKSQAGSFTASAVILRPQSGSTTANAISLRVQTGSFTANAVALRPQAGSFTANAVRFKAQSGSTTADALKKQTQASSFIAAAVIQKTQTGSFAASAVRKATVSSSATVDAVIGKGFAADVTASAVILKVTASTFAASAILFGARAGSTTANAVILRTASTFAAASRSPGVGVSFGRPTPNVAYVAQRFIQGVSGKYVIRFRVWKNGSPTDNIKVDVASDINGTPSTPVHIYTSISGTEMGTSDPGVDTLVVSSESLSAGTYWIVWYRSGGTHAANFYYLNDGLDDYGSGDRASFIVGGSWDVATGEDLYFQFSSGPTLDSVIKSTSTGSFVVAAAILRQAQANRTVDAVLQRPQTGSFGASAVLRREGVGSLVASAVVLRGTSSQFLVAATFLVHREQSYVLDATKLRTTEGTFSLSAVLKREAVGSFAVNAVALATGLGSTHLDALLLRAATGATTVDATIIAAVGGSLSAAALLNSVSRCVWVSPADGVQMSDTPVLVFLMPVAAAGNMHFSIEIDEDAGFGSPLTYTSHGDLTGWEYWDDAAWQPIPQDGVPNTYCGNEARYTVQTPLANGTWHRRVRAGVI